MPPDRVYPALDGLRAVALGAVLISHFFPERSAIQRSFHWGRFGVLLFFVLSGFLITGLLLRGRDAIDTRGVSRGHVFRAFLIRRALRIAPIYYLVVLIGWALSYPPIADLLVFHLTYTGNIALTSFDRPLAQATHLWSLCVEEQFYLLWPLVVLNATRASLPLVAGSLVAFSFGFEAWGALQGRSFEQTHLVLQGCMDALGLGALLAILGHAEPRGRAPARLALGATLVGAPLFLFAQGFRYQVGLRATDRLEYRIPGDIGLALISLALVHFATTSGPSWTRRFLEASPLRYIGKVSYGIYLYHLFLIPIGRWAARLLDVPELSRGVEMFVVYSLVSLGLAALSWRFIEAPINNLKRQVPYPPHAVPDDRLG